MEVHVRSLCSRNLRVMLVITMSFVLMQFAFDAAAQRPRLARTFPPGLPEVRLATSNADQLELNDETLVALEALIVEVQPEEEQLRALTIEVHSALGKLMGTERPAKADLARVAEDIASAAQKTVTLRMQTSLRVRALLTDEQLTRFIQLREDAFTNRGGRRQGRGAKAASDQAASDKQKADPTADAEKD
jgi:Spy/CpxP family protein refolding chaperone